MYATINTKSNYRNLNGQELEVVKFEGTSISVKYFNEEFQADITTSFNLTEISAIREFKRSKQYENIG